jgi:hypothetical protein
MERIGIIGVSIVELSGIGQIRDFMGSRSNNTAVLFVKSITCTIATSTTAVQNCAAVCNKIRLHDVEEFLLGARRTHRKRLKEFTTSCFATHNRQWSATE